MVSHGSIDVNRPCTISQWSVIRTGIKRNLILAVGQNSAELEVHNFRLVEQEHW
jgi:hypothetical protein